MSDDNMYELSFFINYYLNLYKDTTNIYKCGVFVQKIFRDHKFNLIILVIHIFSVKKGMNIFYYDSMTYGHK
jgi:hypothetical protein